MRILFDAFWWVDGPPSGRSVLRALVASWARAFPEDELLAAVRRDQVAMVRESIPAQVGLCPLRSRPQALAAALELPLVARRQKVDVVVAQNYTPISGPSVVFLHDVLFQSNPEWFTPTERLYFTPMPFLARRARRVFTSSHSEAARIRSHNAALAPVAVGLGLSEALTVGPSRAPAEIAALDSFVLCAGRLNVRKNLGRTIAACVLTQRVSAQRPLLVVGEPDGRALDDTPELRLAVDSGAVRFLGYRSDAELRWLYQHADLFVFLSLDEGYGLPPLEARANGCPVLASDIPVLRETLGGAADFVDPLSVPEIAAALDRLLSAPPARTEGDSLAPSWTTVVELMRAEMTATSPELVT